MVNARQKKRKKERWASTERGWKRDGVTKRDRTRKRTHSHTCTHTHTPAIQYCRASPEEEPWKLPLWRGLFARRRQTSTLVKPKSVTTNTTNFMSWNSWVHSILCVRVRTQQRGLFFFNVIYEGAQKELTRTGCCSRESREPGTCPTAGLQEQGQRAAQTTSLHSQLFGGYQLDRNTTYDTGDLAGLQSARSSGPRWSTAGSSP